MKQQHLIMKTNYHQALLPGIYYHLYNRTTGREKAFANDSDISNFNKRWQALLSPYMHHIAYCFIPNHFHFMVQIKSVHEWDLDVVKAQKTRIADELIRGEADHNAFLSDQIRRLFSGYTLWYNLKHHRHGSLFQEKLKRIELKTESRLWHNLCYIHHNGIHHRLTEDYEGWKHSSYHNFFTPDWNWNNLHSSLSWLGNNGEEAKQNFLHEHLTFKHEWRNNVLNIEDDAFS